MIGRDVVVEAEVVKQLGRCRLNAHHRHLSRKSAGFNESRRHADNNQSLTFSTVSAQSGHRNGSRLELLYCTFVCKVVWETNQAVSRDSFETRRSVIHSRTSTSAKVCDQLKSKSAFV
jgi:hypothetical protein